MDWSSCSQVQRDAETLMLEWLADQRGWELQPRRIELPSGACADVDGVAHVAGDTDGDIVALVECFARVTKLKAGQKQKLAKDALKLSMLRHIVAPDAALVLLVASDDVANWLRGRGWIADALDQHGIEVEVVEIATTSATRSRLRKLVRSWSRHGRPAVPRDRFPKSPLCWLHEHDLPRVAKLIAEYYRSYTGRLFDEVACATAPKRFELCDLLALQALNAPFPLRHVRTMRSDTEFDNLLSQISTDVRINGNGAAQALANDNAADRLYAKLVGLDQVGKATASKLMALKRPALVPIRDTKVEDALGVGRGTISWWQAMRAEWESDVLSNRVTMLRTLLNGVLPATVSDLRLLDVAVWCQQQALDD